MGVDGEGIGHVDGCTLFVKDALIGDVIKAKVMKMKKNYGYARLMEILSPSPDRVEPKCAFHKQCGGCQIPALSYENQLEFNQKKVFNNMTRIGGFSEEFVASVRRSGSYIEFHKMEGVGHCINDVMHTYLAMWFNRFI